MDFHRAELLGASGVVIVRAKAHRFFFCLILKLLNKYAE